MIDDNTHLGSIPTDWQVKLSGYPWLYLAVHFLACQLNGFPRFNTHSGSASWINLSSGWKLFFGQTILSKSLVLFFVIHPDQRFPFQKRFKTSHLQEEVNGYMANSVTTVVVTIASAAAGAAIGSIIPGPGTAAGTMLGTIAGSRITDALSRVVGEYADDVVGQYLRYIGWEEHHNGLNCVQRLLISAWFFLLWFFKYSNLDQFFCSSPRKSILLIPFSILRADPNK